ncbi:zinc ABC transporter substrate-binding protein [Mycolicibacterium sp. S2-37]|uniref:metal ABC transporter solute-binding protein, Zn/Mn family n=1 Tax=Mycolicibacterium sp. S2-37 TaxID=2810297 RepID=UPI001A948C81|nr:zinc ABC transporter substrate-binding protein [Mycolicibacterium sp. S2-37]MBO0680829.1 zinc ABC transporter substrate-binding protein [Mycolicibacterium sp. S2-37]
MGAGAALFLPFAAVACSGDQGNQETTPATSGAQAAGDCPTEPVNVVVSVDQWGDIVSDLGGSCAKVTTVLASSAVDPHDFEPAPKDAAVFEGAKLVVVNGGHYDEWAAKLAASSAPDAPVINAIESSGVEEHSHEGGDHAHEGEGHAHEDEAGHDHAGEPNPHVWYNPTAVKAVAHAVTAELSKLAPGAQGYFEERASAFSESLKPYDDAIANIKSNASGKSYAATESVFDDMAAAVGLQNRTPEGYQVASTNEAEPSPADLDAFLRLLGDKGVDVLIYNVQTEGSVPQQIRSAAEQAGVPVVDVTETVPPGTTSFETWQVDQLNALAKALGVNT